MHVKQMQKNTRFNKNTLKGGKFYGLKNIAEAKIRRSVPYPGFSGLCYCYDI
jgi:hypothetical protein